ncbi:MAG: energy-coupling factor transporter transmembrane component T [Nitrososphaerota archaeon]|nr:energy-coupling factor transporter transmembrane protein EcfT [Candidatus Calditenuaceae archaeon]MDW8072756.1 energy-coupling factor transporter transmembrane component T [Nitrososphaerota archaeon]
MSLSLLQALKYRSLDTPIHRLDPRVKLLASFSFLVTALVFGDYWGGMLTVATTIILTQLTILELAKSARYLLTTIKGATPLVALVFILSLLGILDSPLQTLEILYRASASSVRFLAFLTSFNLFFLTTSPDEFGQLLLKLKIPYVYTFTFVAAVRLAPVIADEAQEIIDAQRSRGVEFERGNPVKRVRALVGIFIPLLINSLRRAYEMAEALEVKCFGASERRTSYREIRASKRDVLASIITISSLALALLARGLGLFSGLP